MPVLRSRIPSSRSAAMRILTALSAVQVEEKRTHYLDILFHTVPFS